jgi:putative DNA primase/helicase
MSTTTKLPPAVRYALAYAEHLGWPVLPIAPGGKAPIASLAPRGFIDATTNDGTIRAWWAQAPRANVAVATGRPSGLAVLDIDQLDALDVLVDRFGPMPDTPQARTGGGGLHLFFRWPDQPDDPNAPAVIVPTTTGWPVAGVDTRGARRGSNGDAGGYVLVAPSLHASGERYKWLVSPREVALAPAPGWMCEQDRPQPQMVDVGPIAGQLTSYGHAALRGVLERLAATPQGNRNHALNAAAFELGRLRRHIPSDVAAHTLYAVAAGLGLSPREIRTTLASGYEAGTKAEPAGPEVAT